MTKQEARTYYLQERVRLTAAERETMSAGLLSQFERITFPPLKVVHVYRPLLAKGEIDTQPFVRHLEALFPGLTLVVPRVSGSSDLEHLVWDTGTFFAPGAYGIPEPVEGIRVIPGAVDLVIVPLLIFDRDGFRVGYGRGMYDRFLAQCRPDVLKVGLSLFEPMPRLEDRGEFDVPLSIGVTPTQLYEFV
ncbi:5-formyltetrahydrofolate cyclo-ligase [Dinghuibacter silviterrae]|uniref:5-formyltetrahydrofolate cyclo-ligase n=1 Tax=Dinghuibacter silviterrae TaxID=1539049 RepID=A0A4R8DIK2_9BACT|nr:5-formyltetrahydrofolate cyclo-ligase [Dinghuibacter silviterrae]TDW97571.1 5-formyltetrahydrofolate cyclo-ligase [Dinghuibacter silviterrae]